MKLIWALHHLDQKVTLALNSFGGGALGDAFWPLFSHKEIWFFLYLALAVMLFVRLGWKKALVLLVGVVLTILACDQFANLVKAGVARLRPCYDTYMLEHGVRVLEWKGNHFGFFSAHAANSVGLAVAVTMGFRNDGRLRYRGLAALMSLWALLVSLSRIFVGKHFFGDVLVGIAVGYLFGRLLGLLARKVIRWLEPEDLTLKQQFKPIHYDS